MNRSTITFYLDDAGQLISATQRAGRATPLEVPLPLDQMNKIGKEAAERSIGQLVLRMLNRWHPDAFDAYPNLK